MKKFTLTESEQVNLKTRRGMKDQYEYMAHLVSMDMSIFMEQVKKRLGLTLEDTPKVDIDTGEVVLEDKVYTPSNEEAAKIAQKAGSGSK